MGAAIAIPNLIEPKISWNDTAAIATLRNLARVQEEFRKGVLVDLDGDGAGEFGTFLEMTGALGLRAAPDASRRGERLLSPILSPALQGVARNGLVQKSGYLYRIVLPGKGGAPVFEGDPAAPPSRIPWDAAPALTGSVDADLAEKRWCGMAWPVADWGRLTGRGKDHFGAFFVDEGGTVWRTWNRDKRYVGAVQPMAWDAAMPEGGTGWRSAPTDPSVDEYRGRDGAVWTRLD